ncbi:hypothetical protein V496_00477 [Pseudogymnoascus sp. VKM F-4515 (FW-2607)]|nr:hypothetical protein V496_00477 [Pseudogymnoascus sp. VKM F-4515 (FW-2607)]
MNPPAASLSILPTKGNFACIRCSERKVGCDRRNPCGACVRHNVLCVIRPPKPPRRKRGPSKEKLVLERLTRYEELLQERGIDPNQVTGSSESENHPGVNNLAECETVWRLPMQATIFKPRLVHRQSRTELVDNNLWSRVAEEIHDDEATLGDDSENGGSDGEASDADFSFVLGGKSPITAPSHPPAEIIRQLWQIFIENINPLMKVVHIPSLQIAMDKAIGNIENIPRGFEALMFAIYHIAIISLTDDECKDLMGETKTILLRRYLASTKAALSRAKFMSTASIVVLQALVIHLISIRDIYEPRALWNLTGVAIRIAEGMGMRIDGKLLGLSPFETEIRRRLWWQLKLHDSRAAELCGQAKFQDFGLNNTSPKIPANVNDADLYPSMLQPPEESTRPTEMIWCMFRTELAGFASAQIARMPKLDKAMFANHEYAALDDMKIKEVVIHELIDNLETKYLRFCDPSQPLQLMVLFGARCVANIIRFMTYHPRKWANQDEVPESEQQLVWDIVLRLLEQYNQMQSSPQLRRFAWNVPYFIQWHAIIHVLDSLRAKPLHIDAGKAWGLVNTLYETNLEMCLSTKKPMFVAIGNLCLKAFGAREAALAKENKNLSNPPQYIVRLREQRGEAKARREAAIARNKQRVSVDSEKRSTSMDADNTLLDSNQTPGNLQVEAQTQQNPAASQPANVQSSTRTGDDAFWLNDAVSGNVCACGSAEAMNLDSNDILAQDYWFDTPSGEVMDWEKWDTWLGNNDPVRPTFGS